MNKGKELLSTEELALMRGGFGVSRTLQSMQWVFKV